MSSAVICRLPASDWMPACGRQSMHKEMNRYKTRNCVYGSDRSMVDPRTPRTGGQLTVDWARSLIVDQSRSICLSVHLSVCLSVSVQDVIANNFVYPVVGTAQVAGTWPCCKRSSTLVYSSVYHSPAFWSTKCCCCTVVVVVVVVVDDDDDDST